MEGMGGLIELVLVFGIVLGFAFLELRSLRRYRKRKVGEDAAGPPNPADGASRNSQTAAPED